MVIMTYTYSYRFMTSINIMSPQETAAFQLNISLFIAYCCLLLQSHSYSNYCGRFLFLHFAVEAGNIIPNMGQNTDVDLHVLAVLKVRERDVQWKFRTYCCLHNESYSSYSCVCLCVFVCVKRNTKLREKVGKVKLLVYQHALCIMSKI